MTLLKQALLRSIRLKALLLTIVLVGGLLTFHGMSSQAQPVETTQLLGYGQSAFKLATPSGKVLSQLDLPWSC